MTARRAVYWLKRDLRLRDNPVLTRVLQECEELVFLFVEEPSLVEAPETSAFHVRMWNAALADLEPRLAEHGHRLLVLEGEVTDVLSRLHARWPFQQLVSHEEVGTNRTWERDRAVASWCREARVPWKEERQSAVFRGLRDRSRRSGLRERWMQSPARRVPPDERLRAVRPAEAELLPGSMDASARGALALRARPEGRSSELQPVGEAEAWSTLESFLAGRALGYERAISSPLTAFETGSRLSVHLAFGTISSRSVHQQLEERLKVLAQGREPGAASLERSLSAFAARLAWRDHFMQRLEDETSMEHQALHPAMRDFPFPGGEHLASWLEGRTGFPLVDACMRCLHATGFLNFRMRAHVVSTACHLLRIPWQEVQVALGRLWADYEPGIHIAQVQMQAGMVGINQLRIYDPRRQLLEQDPELRFVHRWVPELRGREVHEVAEHPRVPLPGYPVPAAAHAAAGRAFEEEHARRLADPGVARITQDVLLRHGSRLSAERSSELRTGRGRSRRRSMHRGRR